MRPIKDFSKLYESIEVEVRFNRDTVEHFLKESEGNEDKLPTVLMPKIEAIHPGTTRNFNRYPSEKLRGDAVKHTGIHSWTYPYPKPICYDHNTFSARDISGRVMNAQYITNGQDGKEAVIIVPKITNKEDIRRILNGEFLTVSISASTNSATCSICGVDVMNEEFCGHERGQKYDGTTCEYIVGDVWFNECSWVAVPADPKAQVVSLGIAEAYAQIGNDIYNLNTTIEHSKMPRKLALTEGLIVNDDGNAFSAKGQVEETMDHDENKPIDQVDAPLGTQEGTEDKPATPTFEELQVKYAELDQICASYIKKNLEAEDVIKDLTSKVETAEAAKADAEVKLNTANATITTLTTEKTQLSELSQALEANLHSVIVERALDMKLLVGKLNKTEREAEKQEISVRTNESLLDTIKDLTKEYDSAGGIIPLMNTLRNQGSGVIESNNKNDLTTDKSPQVLNPLKLITDKLMNRS